MNCNNASCLKLICRLSTVTVTINTATVVIITAYSFSQTATALFSANLYSTAFILFWLNLKTITTFICLLPHSIIRPHRSTTYVDAAYSYRPSRVVCRSVTLVSPAKSAVPIELPFGLRTWVGSGNHVLDGGLDPPTGRGKFLGENGRPIVKYRDTLYGRLCKDG